MITKKWNEKFKRPIVCFDFDDVLSDFLGLIIDLYNERMNTSLSCEDVKDWDLGKAGKINVFNQILNSKDFWDQIREKGNSMSVLQRLINDGRYDIYIITACNHIYEYEKKVNFILRHVPGFNPSRIIPCKDKALIRGDILIDDKLDNCKECSEFMDIILMDMPHNRDCDEFRRVKQLEEVPALLETIFY